MSKTYRNSKSRARRKAYGALVGGKKAQTIPQRMDAGRKNHNALELSCVELAAVVYRIELLKTDAELVVKTSSRAVARCTPGIPDRICAMPPTGRLVGFEFKTGRSIVRAKQQRVHDMLRRSGAVVYVIRSIGQFEEVMKEITAAEKNRQL